MATFFSPSCLIIGDEGPSQDLNVGVVVAEILDGRFVPWEKSLEWESYIDLYCLGLMKRGHKCIKYVPSLAVSATQTYHHKFGHLVKRIPVYNRWLLAPRSLLRIRAFSLGYTTIFRQALGPAFTVNMMREAKKDGLHVLHYSSYYTSFFIPAFLAAWRLPMVTQYTGGMLPTNTLRRLFWKLSILPSLKASRAVLLGDYYSEIRSLISDLGVSRAKQEFFNAPVIDSNVFHEFDKRAAQENLGFNPKKKNILCVTYIPPKSRRSELLAKNPYLMLDIIERAVRTGGDEIELHVAGWGVGLDEFRGYVRDDGMTNRVHIFGHVEHTQLPVYYSASDLLFVPYRLETLNEGSATVEAFACGRPVAAFKRNSTDQAEQLGGFLVETDPQLGARTLLDRLRKPGYLEGKGREGLALAGQFTLDFAGKRLEEIYAKAVEG